MGIKEDLNQWDYLLRDGEGCLRRELSKNDFSGYITKNHKDVASFVVQLMEGVPTAERFNTLKARRSELEKIGMYYSAVPGSGNLRLDKLRFPSQWGAEIAMKAIQGRQSGEELGTAREILKNHNEKLVDIICFCDKNNIDLDMEDFIRNFRSSSDLAKGLKVAPTTTRLSANLHPFLDKKYCIHPAVVSFPESESKLEELLAENDNFRMLVDSFHHGTNGGENTIVKANQGAISAGAYSNFDIYSITKINVLGKAELRTSVFELK